MTTSIAPTTTARRLGFDPTVSLRYHFGMLLGVEDLEVEQTYHRSKQWLHNAWMHGEGVVWGLGVSFDENTFEIRVEPGLALDAAGRELYLPYVSCVHLGRWYEEHEGESAFEFDETPDGVDFTARVVIRFNTCLERPVPAISEECTNAAVSTAYSRTRELPLLEIHPATAPLDGDPTPPSHLVRLLFGLDRPTVDDDGTVVPDDQDVLDASAAISLLAPAERPEAILAAIRRFAARDVTSHRPSTPGGQLPADPDTVVVLAEVTITSLTGSEATGWTVGTVMVDNDVRPALISTRTIQELRAGDIAITGVSAGRLRVDRSSLRRTAADTLELELVGEALAGSETAAFEAAAWNDGTASWRSVAATAVLGASSGSPPRQPVTVTLAEDLADDDLIRLIIRGTGATPLLGTDRLPLAGGSDGPAASAHDGLDFVHMARASALDA